MEIVDRTAVIEAFADGEPVLAETLTDALADASARAHLVDVLVLRGIVAGHAATKPIVVPTAVAASPRRMRWLLATAALVVCGVTGGFLAGRQTSVTLPAAQGYVTVAPSRVDPVSAPAPTRVIRLKSGVDWNERAGGN